MTTGIVGLGLIGGSFAKAVKENTSHKVLTFDKNQSVNLQAKLEGASDGILNADMLGECDFVIIALYPKATENYLKENAGLIKKGAIVIDAAGVKVNVCNTAAKLAKKHGFTFIGGHPMAGTQNSGFRHSRSSLFRGAPMLLTPSSDEGIKTLEKAKKFFLEIGFGSVVFTTPEEHDQRIAYTSQLAHVVSNAYVKSPQASEHKGFSAGSYKDLTRVARLNEEMWAELFLENRGNLLTEIDFLINSLGEYKAALENCDSDKLKALLKEGVERKERVERGN
ncbi:MAG: prephenate dehydrogenase/arogenate dehydrogenase family protein [Oscillospiraceae bacterium]|nr:prephenate dehydrogenase/arogenate dehydrogenase family protein [Oscillospiraceae bacterium]